MYILQSMVPEVSAVWDKEVYPAIHHY